MPDAAPPPAATPQSAPEGAGTPTSPGGALAPSEVGASGADSGAAAAPPPPAKAKDIAAAAREAYRLRQERKALRGETLQMRQSFAQVQQQLKEQSDANARLQAQLERTKTDPLGVAKELNGNPEDGIRNFLAAGTPEAKIAALEKQVEEERKARLEGEQRRREQEHAANVGYAQRAEQQKLHAFVEMVVKAPQTYKHLLAEYEPQEILAQVAQVHEWAKKQRASDGSPAQYSFDEVAAFLDSQAKLVHDRRSERRSKLLAPAPPAETESAPANGQSRHTDTEKTKSPKAPTIRSGPTTRKALTRDEEAAEDLAVLNRAFEKDRAAQNGTGTKH